MNVPNKTIRQAVEDAYDAGYRGRTAAEVVEELVAAIRVKVPPEQVERTYTAAELTAFPIGTKFKHSILGACEVVETYDKVKGMYFPTAGTAFFKKDGPPWDKPMKLVTPESEI